MNKTKMINDFVIPTDIIEDSKGLKHQTSISMIQQYIIVELKEIMAKINNANATNVSKIRHTFNIPKSPSQIKTQCLILLKIIKELKSKNYKVELGKSSKSYKLIVEWESNFTEFDDAEQKINTMAVKIEEKPSSHNQSYGQSYNHSNVYNEPVPQSINELDYQKHMFQTNQSQSRPTRNTGRHLKKYNEISIFNVGKSASRLPTINE